MIQCPSCLHFAFEGTFLCTCGKLLELDPDAINRIKEAFGFVHLQSLQEVPKCGPSPWQWHHHKARIEFRGATKGERGFTSIWDRLQNDAAYRQSQLVHKLSDAWVRYFDHIVQFSIFHDAPQQQRERNMHILYLRSVDDNQQAPPLSHRPGYREANEQFRHFYTRRKENN